MNDDLAVDRLSALANRTRLDLFRLLLAAGGEGLPAGEIARRLAAPASTTSAHLAILARVGLIAATRDGRVIRYWVQVDAVRVLLEHLIAECCGGRPELCEPLLEAMTALRAPGCGGACG